MDEWMPKSIRVIVVLHPSLFFLRFDSKQMCIYGWLTRRMNERVGAAPRRHCKRHRVAQQTAIV